MAITRNVDPAFIVAGRVESVRDITGKQEKNLGDLVFRVVTIRQDNEARLEFKVWARDVDSVGPLDIGAFVAVEASYTNSREFGGELTFRRPAFDALDLIHSNMQAA